MTKHCKALLSPSSYTPTYTSIYTATYTATYTDTVSSYTPTYTTLTLTLPHYLLHSHQDCDQKLAPPFPSLSARMRAYSTNLTAYLCRIVSARNVRNSPKIAHFVIVCSRTKVDSVCFIFCFNLSCFQCCGSSELSVSEFSLHSPVFAYIDCIMCGSCIL